MVFETVHLEISLVNYRPKQSFSQEHNRKTFCDKILQVFVCSEMLFEIELSG